MKKRLHSRCFDETFEKYFRAVFNGKIRGYCGLLHRFKKLHVNIWLYTCYTNKTSNLDELHLGLNCYFQTITEQVLIRKMIFCRSSNIWKNTSLSLRILSFYIRIFFPCSSEIQEFLMCSVKTVFFKVFQNLQESTCISVSLYRTLTNSNLCRLSLTFPFLGMAASLKA